MFPVRRNLADPGDPGVLHGDGRVEALGDGVGNGGGALLFEEVDETPFRIDERVDAVCFPIQKVHDLTLLFELRKG